MSNLLDLSGKIDPASLALFETLNEAAGSNGVSFFLVGATARDIIFERGYGLSNRRATKDVDIGVRVDSWDGFKKLKESLLKSGHLKETMEVQRLVYQGELLIDILPFGGIANDQCEIRWPPDEVIVMSVAGFEDAYRAAHKVRVRANPPLDILVASPVGLTIMKLIAWADRPYERRKDAQDFAYILEKYLDVGNDERLREKHTDLVAVENFDYVGAGARLLGRDIASIGHPKTIGRIREILANETADDSQFRLIQAMNAGRGAALEERENRFEEPLALLRQLMKGIEDR